jgi:Protein of unknown function (DUF1569)
MARKSLFDAAAEAEIRARLARLEPDAAARWGRFDAPRMLCHLSDAFRISLGDVPATPVRMVLRFSPVRRLFVHTLPWPKGKLPTGPEFLATQPASWAADVAAFDALLARAVERGRSARPAWATHPAFGDMPNREWGWLFQRHIDHHFRQFGI